MKTMRDEIAAALADEDLDDDGKIALLRHGGDVRIRREAEDGRAFGVHREYAARELNLLQVFHHRAPDGAGRFGRADDGDSVSHGAGIGAPEWFGNLLGRGPRGLDDRQPEVAVLTQVGDRNGGHVGFDP